MSRRDAFTVEHYWENPGPEENPKRYRTKITSDLTSRMKMAYRNGQCHALALAIHKQEGHPLGVVHSYGEPNHFFNYDKNNPKMGFDVDGHRPVKDIVEDYGTSHHKISPSYIEKHQKNGRLLNPNHEAAHVVASTLIGPKQEK